MSALAAPTTPGCFTYIFLVCISLMGYLPFGLHGTDFSKDSKKLAYTYNLKEVRIYDLETKTAGEPLYTAPAGWLVDTVHWDQKSGEIYAVAHNYPLCEAFDDGNSTSVIDRKFKTEVMGLKPGGGKRTIITREFYCPDLQGEASQAPAEGGIEPQLHASYQKNLGSEGISFKPTGWKDGYVYYVEPEELTKRPSSVYRLDLASGKPEKLFALPDEDKTYSCVLSPEAAMLACLSLSKPGDKEIIALTLRDVKSGKKIYTDAVATEPSKNNSEASDNEAMLLSLISGAEGMTAFDEKEKMFFYLKLDDVNKKTRLMSLDLETNKTSTVYESYTLGAPLPVPGRKALLVSAFDESLADVKPEIGSSKPQFDITKGTTEALVSYDGKILKTLDMPPLTHPLLHMRAPDASVSPDGNFAAFTVGYKISAPDAAASLSISDLERTVILPALIDIEKGTFEILITKPEDNLAAGMYFYSLELYSRAKTHLEKYLAASKPGGTMFTEAAFTLFLIYQNSGAAAESDALYKKIYSELLTGDADAETTFAVKYFNAAGANNLEMIETNTNPDISALPQAGRIMDSAKFDFAIAELRKAEAKGSKRAPLLIAVFLASANRYSAAAEQLEKAEPSIPKELEYGTRNLDFFIAQLHQRAGNCAKAAERYTKYLEAPIFSEGDALQGRAECNIELGNIEKAIEDYRKLLDNAKEDLKNAIENNWGDETETVYRDKITGLEKKISELEKK